MASALAAAGSCPGTAACSSGAHVLAFGQLGIPGIPNPLNIIGGAVKDVVGDFWTTIMMHVWACGLWLLTLAFKIIGAFTTPDVTGGGPLARVLPITMGIGVTVAVLMMFVQLSVALMRRDGQSLSTVVIGIAQFGAVWIGYLVVGAAMVAAAAGLEQGILQSTMHANSFSDLNLSHDWLRTTGDATLATVLGLLSFLLLIPASFFYLLIMFVREAAILLLLATAPISAAGLLSEATKTWFWKSLRWFIAALLIAPTTALVLGIGEQLTTGVVAGGGDKTAAAAGTAVVGTILVAIGSVCPIPLFRLLAFVEPGNASGAALRQSWSDAGGMAGLMSGGQSAGSGAASQSGSDGRSGGESGADSQTESRMAGMLGGAGRAVQTAASIAHRAADIGSDILGGAGVGSPGYSMTPTDERTSRRKQSGGGSQSGSGGSVSSSPVPEHPPGSDGGGGSGGGQLPGGGAIPGGRMPGGGMPGGGGGEDLPGSGGGGLPGGGGAAGGAGGAGGVEAAAVTL